MSKNGTVMVACARCGNVKLHHARGCCKCCYNKVIARGLQSLFPTRFGLPGFATRDDFHPWKQGGVYR